GGALRRSGGTVASEVLLHDCRRGVRLVQRAIPGQVGTAGRADQIVLLDVSGTGRAGQGRHVVLRDGGSECPLSLTCAAGHGCPRHSASSIKGWLATGSTRSRKPSARRSPISPARGG